MHESGRLLPTSSGKGWRTRVSKLPPHKAAKLTRTCQDARQRQQDRWTPCRRWHHKALARTMGGRERVHARPACYHFPSPRAPQGDLRSALPSLNPNFACAKAQQHLLQHNYPTPHSLPSLSLKHPLMFPSRTIPERKHKQM